MKPKEILIKHGHVVEFKDGSLANYFENSLGKFLCFGKCICGLNLEDYDENLFYLDRDKCFCDIVKIYKVNSSHFFEGDFESFKWSLGMQINNYTKYKSIDLIFTQMAAIADKDRGEN